MKYNVLDIQLIEGYTTVWTEVNIHIGIDILRKYLSVFQLVLRKFVVLKDKTNTFYVGLHFLGGLIKVEKVCKIYHTNLEQSNIRKPSFFYLFQPEHV